MSATPWGAGGGFKNVLVIGADALSRYVDWTDRATCILFGDGCGAVLVQVSSPPGLCGNVQCYIYLLQRMIMLLQIVLMHPCLVEDMEPFPCSEVGSLEGEVSRYSTVFGWFCRRESLDYGMEGGR